MMGKVKLLPGATMSRILRGRPRRTEKGARFTLADLTIYLARQIGIYHHTKHSSLDRSPRSAWEHAIKRGDSWVLPQVPANREDFLVRLLPSVLRTVNREGVHMFALRYQSHELERLIAPGRPRFVRYDPRDLSKVFVEEDNARVLAVPLSDRHWPALSLWEWQEMRRRQIAGSHGGDAEWAARALRANQALNEGRANAGRLRDRRRLERARQWNEARAPTLHANRELIVSGTIKDTPLPCEVLE
jgi:putative transposase